MAIGKQHGSKGRRQLFRGLALAAVAACGLLLWARLKLVTQTPRMVYAEPGAEVERDTDR